jgi:hypothetical protein
MKEIPLTQNKVTFIDDENYEWLKQWKWCAVKVKTKNYEIYYAVRHTHGPHHKRKFIYMHRLILSKKLGRELKSSEHCDHRDRNGLHNWFDNLRIATNAQNQQNRYTSNKYGYRGITLRNKHKFNPWEANIRINGDNCYLGCFSTPEEAAHAYDKAAKKHFGEFARLNFSLKKGETNES